MTWTRSGDRRHFVTLTEPDGDPQPDGDGGYTQPMRNLAPSGVWAKLEPATARSQERAVAGSVVSTATHLVTMPYHSGVTTQTVIDLNGRTLKVVGVANPSERNIDTVLTAVEDVP